MKKLFLPFTIVSILFFSDVLLAQTTRIHLFRTSRSSIFNEKLYPTLNLGKPITIPFKTYIVIEIKTDSVSFDSGKTQGYIKYEKGKNYYFRIRKEENEPISMIEEISEQVFKMTLLLNNSALKPEVVHQIED